MSKKYNAISNAEENISHSFLKGAAILTLSMVVVKIIGLLDQVLLTNIYSMFGEEYATMGSGLFSNAYEILLLYLRLLQEDFLLQFPDLYQRV